MEALGIPDKSGGVYVNWPLILLYVRSPFPEAAGFGFRTARSDREIPPPPPALVGVYVISVKTLSTDLVILK